MYLLEINATEIQIAGTCIFIIGTAWLLVEFNSLKKELKEKLGKTDDTKTLKLQAYERLTLYTERSGLKNLVSRLHSENLSAADLQLILLQTLNSEYEYNVTQQIYVTPELWTAITKLRDQNIFIINQIAAVLPPTATSLHLSRALLEYAAANNAEMSKIVLDALQYEAKKLL